MYGPQRANPQIVTFAEGPHMKKLVRIYADLRLAELICGPTTFDDYGGPSFLADV
jgi:hypothetical protein